MNFLDKLKQRTEEIKNKVVNTVTHITVSDAVKEERMAICNSCEFLFTPTMQCKKCGCFVHAKTSIAMFECPVKKWVKITEAE